MFMSGKCPKCEAAIGGVVTGTEVGHIEIGNKASGPLYYGVAIVCAKCKSVLGISIDPIRIREEIIDEVLENLNVKRRKRR